MINRHWYLVYIYIPITSTHYIKYGRIKFFTRACAGIHLLLVYIVHIVDIAMLYKIIWTSSRHRLSLISLFTSFTSSISQCYSISYQYRVDIVYLKLPCLYRLHRRHLNIVPCRMNILFEIYKSIKFFEYVLSLIRNTNL